MTQLKDFAVTDLIDNHELIWEEINNGLYTSIRFTEGTYFCWCSVLDHHAVHANRGTEDAPRHAEIKYVVKLLNSAAYVGVDPKQLCKEILNPT